MLPRSTNATRAPTSRALSAAVPPAGPAPITMTSSIVLSIRVFKGEPASDLFCAPLLPNNGKIYNLGYLPPGGVVAGAELQAAGSTRVSGDDVVTVRRFYVCVEGVGTRHVAEGRLGW